MINIKTLTVVFAACILMPLNTTDLTPKYKDLSNAQCWWSILYPQLSGIDVSNKTKASDIKQSLKLSKFLQNSSIE